MILQEFTGSQIDTFSVVPKYYQLKEILLRKIEDGEWEQQKAIPSERELEILYNVSRTTIRKALDLLVRKGYLYREQGKGTFVALPHLQQNLHWLTSFTEDMKRRGFASGQRILTLSLEKPSRRIAQSLNLDPDKDQVVKVERLRFGNDEPIGIHIAYLPVFIGAPFTIEELETYQSLYSLLKAKYKVVIMEADESLEATIADEMEAQLLGIQEGSPLLLIERISRTSEGIPVEYVKMLYRADRYKYYVHMVRDVL